MRVRALVDRWGDAVLALVFVAWTQSDLWGHAPTTLRVVGGRGVLAVLLILMTAALALRRRAPAATLFIAAASLAVAAVLVRDSAGGVPVEVFIAMLIAFYSVGAHSDERHAPLVGGLALALIAATDLARPGFFNGGHSARPAAWLAFAIAWLVGRDMRRRRQRVLALESRAERLEREREEKAQVAVSEERARIARELHDIVAHGVSVIVAQARAGPHLIHDPEAATNVFRSIETSGRDALVELRRLLGILRSDDQQLAIGPQPGLDSLQSLLEQVRASGVSVQLRVEGDPVHLPAGIDLSAYRIVQEALTNVVKHASATSAEVVVRFDMRALELDVLDDGHGPSASNNGAGHGLIGMRERAALYGGTIETGSQQGAGYAVHARLPLGEPA
jgi:signal transduction histidine kinase